LPKYLSGSIDKFQQVLESGVCALCGMEGGGLVINGNRKIAVKEMTGNVETFLIY
jgi:hypothetical protein